MIILEDKTPVAKGRKRACYTHPDNPDRMIKVLLPEALPSVVRKNSTSLRRRMLPARFLDEQRKELLAFKRLEAKLRDEAWRHIPEFFGTVETDKGLGLVTRFVRSADGTAGVNLTRYFPDDYSEPISACVSNLFSWIIEHGLAPRDFGLYNVVIAYDEMKSPHAWLVDGFGSAEFLPLSEWNRRHGQRMARRRVARFEKRLKRLLNTPASENPRYPLTLDR